MLTNQLRGGEKTSIDLLKLHTEHRNASDIDNSISKRRFQSQAYFQKLDHSIKALIRKQFKHQKEFGSLSENEEEGDTSEGRGEDDPKVR
jgi:hypothetical protein